MSNEHIIQTVVELVIGGLLIYGFMHEDKFIRLKKNIKRIVVGNYRRWKRMRGNKK